MAKFYYVLFDPSLRMFAKSGCNGGMSCSMNIAKHFTSLYSAEMYKKRSSLYGDCIIKKILRQ